MKTLNSNENKMIIIIIVLITISFDGKASNFLLNLNGSLNLEFIFPIICVGILALLLFTAFLRQKSN